MKAILISLFFLPLVTFQQEQVRVELFDDSTVGEYRFVFSSGASREAVYQMFRENNKRLLGGDRTLKEIELWEDEGDRWIVRHRYGVGFAFFTDWTDIVLDFSSAYGDPYDEVRWQMYESLDGKIVASDGYYRIYDGEDGGAEVRYYSRTEYASRKPVVAFALRNFSIRMLKTTFTRLFETIETD